MEVVAVIGDVGGNRRGPEIVAVSPAAFVPREVRDYLRTVTLISSGTRPHVFPKPDEVFARGQLGTEALTVFGRLILIHMADRPIRVLRDIAPDHPARITPGFAEAFALHPGEHSTRRRSAGP